MMQPSSSTPGTAAGLVWLVGCDGNDNGALERERQARMLARRADPAGIPAADRMPPAH